jgi:hypothetical protein
MATATKTDTFNYDLFRKRVRLFDSDADGERNAAIRQALKQCAECDPPMHFWEAAGTAFGDVDIEERERLTRCVAWAEADAEEQRRIAEEQRRKADRSVEAAAQQKEINDRLRQDNARLNEALEGRDVETVDEENWFDVPWLKPDNLASTMLAVLVAEWNANAPLGRFFFEDYAPIVAEWLHTAVIVVFLLWVFFLGRGPGKILVKQLACWIAGWAVVVAFVASTNDNFNIHSYAFKLLLVPSRWWGTMGLPFDTGDYGIATLTATFVADCNGGFTFLRSIIEGARNAVSFIRHGIDALKS